MVRYAEGQKVLTCFFNLVSTISLSSSISSSNSTPLFNTSSIKDRPSNAEIDRLFEQAAVSKKNKDSLTRKTLLTVHFDQYLVTTQYQHKRYQCERTNNRQEMVYIMQRKCAYIHGNRYWKKEYK